MFCHDEFAIEIAARPEYFGHVTREELHDPASCYRQKSRRLIINGRYVRVPIRASSPPAGPSLPGAVPLDDPRIAAVAGDAIPVRLTREISHTFSIHVAIARRSSRKRLEVAAFVAATCTTQSGRAWCCLSCAQLLANDAQLAFHLETDRHVIAKICELHGAEVERQT